MQEITYERLLEVINSIVMNYEIKKEELDLDLVKVGLDSISFIQMIVLLECEFNVEIPDSFLLMSEMNTVNKIKMILNSLT